MSMAGRGAVRQAWKELMSQVLVWEGVWKAWQELM